MKLLDRPLTGNMIAALEHLTEKGDRVLVREVSQWWMRESDNPTGGVVWGAEIRDTGARLQQSWSMPNIQIIVIPTATVKALVVRGILKMKGPKRKVLGDPKKGKEFWRAELTPFGTAVREQLEDRAHATYQSLLTSVRVQQAYD